MNHDIATSDLESRGDVGGNDSGGVMEVQMQKKPLSNKWNKNKTASKNDEKLFLRHFQVEARRRRERWQKRKENWLTGEQKHDKLLLHSLGWQTFANTLVPCTHITKQKLGHHCRPTKANKLKFFDSINKVNSINFLFACPCNDNPDVESNAMLDGFVRAFH